MRIRTLLIALAVGIATAGLAGGALADDFEGGSVITSKDVVGETVMLRQTRFRVTDRTRILDENGNRIGLGLVPSLEEGASEDEAAVWYEARGSQRGPVLTMLRLTGSAPR